MCDWEKLRFVRQMSDASCRTYYAAYKRLCAGLERPISVTGQRTLIAQLPTIAPNPNSQASLLNLAIMVKIASDKPTSELDEHRAVVAARIQAHKRTRNRIKSEELPTLRQLQLHSDTALNDGRWLSFVIQRLLLYLGCRCLDLNLLVVYDRHLVGKTDNYLLVRSRDLVVVRNVYKTAKTFGPKRHVLKCDSLYRAVCRLSRYSEEPLLMTVDGGRCLQGGISKYVSRHTFEGLGETDYFKVMVKDAASRTSGGWQALAELSERRGTAIETIVSAYDLSLQ